MLIMHYSPYLHRRITLLLFFIFASGGAWGQTDRSAKWSERVLIYPSIGFKLTDPTGFEFGGFARLWDGPKFSLDTQAHSFRAKIENFSNSAENPPRVITCAGSTRFFLSRTLNAFGGGCQVLFTDPRQYLAFVGWHCCTVSQLIQLSIGGLKKPKKRSNEAFDRPETVCMLQFRATNFSWLQRFRATCVYSPRTVHLQWNLCKRKAGRSLEFGASWYGRLGLPYLHGKLTISYDPLALFHQWGKTKNVWFVPLRIQLHALSPYDLICLKKPLRLTRYACVPLMVPAVHGFVPETSSGALEAQRLSSLDTHRGPSFDRHERRNDQHDRDFSDTRSIRSDSIKYFSLAPPDAVSISDSLLAVLPECDRDEGNLSLTSAEGFNSERNRVFPSFPVLIQRLESFRIRHERPLVELEWLHLYAEKAHYEARKHLRLQDAEFAELQMEIRTDLRLFQSLQCNCREFFLWYSPYLLMLMRSREPLDYLDNPAEIEINEVRRILMISTIYLYLSDLHQVVGEVWFREILNNWKSFYPIHPILCLLEVGNFWHASDWAPDPSAVEFEYMRILEGFAAALEREEYLYRRNPSLNNLSFSDFADLLPLYNPQVPRADFDQQLQRIREATLLLGERSGGSEDEED